MNILVTNDDGIMAKGINDMVKALSEVADVYVIAPDSQRSGASHSITMHKKLWFKKASVKGAVKAYSFTGTPADCVKMGIQLLKEENIKIDAVFSGINHGGNLGTDTLYSGTVGAAREGVVNGIFSVAMSVNSHEAQDFGYACQLAVCAAKAFERGAFNKHGDYLLNINVPNLPINEIKGLKIAKLGIRDYDNWFNPVYYEDGSIEICYEGKPVSFDVANNIELPADVLMMDKGYATLTALGYDLTADELSTEDMEKIFAECAVK